jgi:hypothetical protein
MGYLLPKDLVDVTGYLVGGSVLCRDPGLPVAMELLTRGKTMGEAMKLLEKVPEVRVTIQMPEPRKPPWQRLPVILVEERVRR